MKLRRPTDTLAGCMWLPRFVDKVRHHHAGTLDAEFARPFCNPLATDGEFFRHFVLTKDEIVTVVIGSAGDDQIVAAWFAARPASSPDRIAAWNTLAPELGKPGQPLRRAFEWARRHYYGDLPDPRVVSIFTAIAFDEGFIDEIAPTATA